MYIWASLVSQMVKNLPAVRETQVGSLGQEDPLEREMATHSSILAWEILRTEEPGRLQSLGSQRVRHNLVTEQQCFFVLFLFFFFLTEMHISGGLCFIHIIY